MRGAATHSTRRSRTCSRAGSGPWCPAPRRRQPGRGPRRGGGLRGRGGGARARGDEGGRRHPRRAPPPDPGGAALPARPPTHPQPLHAGRGVMPGVRAPGGGRGRAGPGGPRGRRSAPSPRILPFRAVRGGLEAAGRTYGKPWRRWGGPLAHKPSSKRGALERNCRRKGAARRVVGGHTGRGERQWRGGAAPRRQGRAERVQRCWCAGDAARKPAFRRPPPVHTGAYRGQTCKDSITWRRGGCSRAHGGGPPRSACCGRRRLAARGAAPFRSLGEPLAAWARALPGEGRAAAAALGSGPRLLGLGLAHARLAPAPPPCRRTGEGDRCAPAAAPTPRGPHPPRGTAAQAPLGAGACRAARARGRLPAGLGQWL
jgi:hypothetical protein